VLDWTNLHLCPLWFNPSTASMRARSAADVQAASVIHEIAHDVIGADDDAYMWETAKYNACRSEKP